MEVWLRERVLQRYVIENFSKYKPFGLKIISKPEDNKDKFPDLWCHLENGKRVPAEVEWKSSNFVQHKHDLNFIRENEGFLFVCEDDQNNRYYCNSSTTGSSFIVLFDVSLFMPLLILRRLLVAGS